MTLADKLIVMHAGLIQQIGKPEAIYRFPRNKFVAGFIGSPPMNFLDCRFDSTKGALVGDAFEYPIGSKWQEIIKTDEPRDLILGIRPEDMVVNTSPVPGAVQAKVYVQEQLGREILLNAIVGEETVRAIAASDSRLEAEQKVWLAFDDRAIHVFEWESEESLLRSPATVGQVHPTASNDAGQLATE